MLKLIKLFFISVAILCVAPLAFAATPQQATPPTQQFLALSDLHFEPYYDCPANAKPGACELMDHLISDPVSQWAEDFHTYGAPQDSQYGQDTDDVLLRSALKAASAQKVKFVVISGDFLSHDYKEHYIEYTGDTTLQHYQTFVDKTFRFLSMQLKAAFPRTPIYAALGNNDSYHGDYYADPNNKNGFYASLLSNKNWGQFFLNLKNRTAFNNQFLAGGYYEVTPPNAKSLRVILLNTVLLSAKVKGPSSAILAQAAKDELHWLQQQLQAAKAKHLHVLLVAHIPAGMDVFSSIHKAKSVPFLKATYNQQFLQLLADNQSVITAFMTGHIHQDAFRLIDANTNVPDVVNTFVPSITPKFGNNPGFKVYTLETSHFNLVDFVTYYLNLSGDRQWAKEYDFNRVYQPQCQGANCRVEAGMQRLQQDNDLAAVYRLLYGVSNPHSSVAKHWQAYWCAIHHLDAKGYASCAGL
jgi:sphingomyelin phosphodiesterase acid-like 3